MCIWGRLIVTGFTGSSMQCSSDGVNPSRLEDAIQLSTISAHSTATSNTNSQHFNTSTSTTIPPHPSQDDTHSLLRFKPLFIDHCTVTFTFFSTVMLLTVHRFKQRWLPHHHISFIRLQEKQIIILDVMAHND